MRLFAVWVSLSFLLSPCFVSSNLPNAKRVTIYDPNFGVPYESVHLDASEASGDGDGMAATLLEGMFLNAPLPDENDKDSQYKYKPFCVTLRFAPFKDLPDLVPAPPRRRADRCKVYTPEGTQITSFDDVQDGMDLHIVPNDRTFVWPSVKLGFKRTLVNMTLASPGSPPIVMETLSTAPRVFRLHNFLSEEEVDTLVNRAKALKMSQSTGGLQKADSEGTQNQGEILQDRTSDNSWDTDSEDAIGIKKRAFELLKMPWNQEWSDGLQVVRYRPPQFYNYHNDFFDPGATKNWNWEPRVGGVNRFATVFLYLSDNEWGGNTVFPKSTTKVEKNATKTAESLRLRDEVLKIQRHRPEYNMVKQCEESFHVKPKKGDAILFYLQDPTGLLDTNSLHGACPVLSGEKWGANLWVWNGPVWNPYVEPDKPQPQYIGPANDHGGVHVTFKNVYDKATISVFWTDESGKKRILKVLKPKEWFSTLAFQGNELSTKTHSSPGYVIKYPVTAVKGSKYYSPGKGKKQPSQKELDLFEQRKKAEKKKKDSSHTEL